MTKSNRHSPHLVDSSREALKRLVQRLYSNMETITAGCSVMLSSPDSAQVSVLATLSLARYLAEDETRSILVVDACLRQQELGRSLQAIGVPGLLEYLDHGEPSVQELVRPSSIARVSILPAGTSKTDLNLLLKSGESRRRLQDGLRSLKQEYTFILLCAPSVLLSSYSLVFPSLVDCVLALVTPGKTRRQDASAFIETLRNCDAREIGLLVCNNPG